MTEPASVGQRFNHWDGKRTGVVQKVYGKSSRCQDGRAPVLVDVLYDEGKSNVQEWERK